MDANVCLAKGVAIACCRQMTQPHDEPMLGKHRQPIQIRECQFAATPSEGFARYVILFVEC
jgi:hypothetical protein